MVLVSRGQTAFFSFSFGRDPMKKKKKSGLAGPNEKKKKEAVWPRETNMV